LLPLVGISILLIGKIFALIGLAIYIVFALVVLKQVYLMVGTIEVGFGFLIKLVAWAHLIFAVFVFLTAMIIL
jgi:hypothetical protein